jgi:hypothetical protein
MRKAFDWKLILFGSDKFIFQVVVLFLRMPFWYLIPEFWFEILENEKRFCVRHNPQELMDLYYTLFGECKSKLMRLPCCCEYLPLFFFFFTFGCCILLRIYPTGYYDAVNRNTVSIRQLSLLFLPTHYMFRPLQAIFIVYLTWRWPVGAETCSNWEEIKGRLDVLRLCCDWRHHRNPSIYLNSFFMPEVLFR